MNVEKILPYLSYIEEAVSLVRGFLYCPDGIRITAIWRDDLSYVEYWDGDVMPRILGLAEEKVDELVLQQWIFDGVGMISPSACGSKRIELHSDIGYDSFCDGIQVAIDVFSIKYESPSDSLIKTIKERNDFNNHLSQLKTAPGELKERLRIYGDNRLSNSGSSPSRFS